MCGRQRTCTRALLDLWQLKDLGTGGVEIQRWPSLQGARRRVTPSGNADGCEKKGVAGKAIRKSMKAKDRQIGLTRRHRTTELTRRPHTPRVLYGCETKGVAGKGIWVEGEETTAGASLNFILTFQD